MAGPDRHRPVTFISPICPTRGRPAIATRHRRPRRRDASPRPARLLLLAGLVLGCAAVPAAAEEAPTTTTAPAAAAPAPAAPVDWFPLRHNPDGRPVKIGCTYNSQGSQFGYSCGGHHSRWALDLIADQGTPVYAVRLGFATNTTGQRGGSGYGNVVRIDHGDGTETLYAHLSEVLVPAEGMWVDQTTVIGLVGSTGSSSAPHLHYEKRLVGQSEPVDPGALTACLLGIEVRYPEVVGHDSWYGLPWGAFELSSDGTDCAEAVPATPVRRPGVSRIEAELPTDDLLRAILELGFAARP